MGISYFDDEPSRPRQAYQAWLVLICKASNRQTMTYGELAQILGFKGASPIGNVLDYIYQYCKQNSDGLPPLSIIVVNKQTGKPGSGMPPDFSEQERVFQFDWYSVVPPMPEALKQAFDQGRQQRNL